MNHLQVDWQTVFRPDLPLLETVVRGTVIYLSVFVLLRVGLRRTAGELTMLDFVFVLLAAGAGADAMLGGSTSIANSVVLVVTIVGWNYLLNWLGFKIPWIERLMSPPPLQVVRDGQMLRKNMRRELLTREELETHMREDGILDIAHIKAAFVEGDGNISFIPYTMGSSDQAKQTLVSEPGGGYT